MRTVTRQLAYAELPQWATEYSQYTRRSTAGTADRATGRGLTGQHLLQDEKGLLVRREHIVFLQCSGEGGKHLRLNSRGARRRHGGTATTANRPMALQRRIRQSIVIRFGIIGITETERFISFTAKKKWQ